MNLFKRLEVLETSGDIKGRKYKLIDIIIMTIYGFLFEMNYLEAELSIVHRVIASLRELGIIPRILTNAIFYETRP